MVENRRAVAGIQGGEAGYRAGSDRRRRRAPAREAARRRAGRAAEGLMNPDAVAVLIPVVLFGGFFAWMIARTVSKAYTAKLQGGNQAGAAGVAKHEELAAGLEELRREV